MSEVTKNIGHQITVVKEAYMELNKIHSYDKIAKELKNIAIANKQSEFEKHQTTLRKFLQNLGNDKPTKMKLEHQAYLNFLFEAISEVKHCLNGEQLPPPAHQLPLDKELQNLFYDKFKLQFRVIQKSKPLELEQSFFATRYKILSQDVAAFVTAFPVVLMSVVNSKEYNQELISKLKYYATEEEIESKPICISKLEKDCLWVGHALSGYSDNLGLFYDLGRACRFAEIFDKNLTIQLVDFGWALNNSSVIQLDESGYNVSDNLSKCTLFRSKLYKKMNIRIEKLGVGDVGTIKNKLDFDIDKERIELLSDNFAELCNDLKESWNIDQIQKKEDIVLKISNHIEELEAANYHLPKCYESSAVKFLKYAFLRRDKKNILSIIKSVVKNYKRLDKKAFQYTLIQRFIQHKYNNYLKLAVISETQFDESFHLMDMADGYKIPYAMRGLYFEQYYFATTDARKKLEVIPYYFPSGVLRAEMSNDLTIIPEKAAEKAILIFDHLTSERREKVKKLLYSLDGNQLAIQMCDFMSFINYFFKPDEESFWKIFWQMVKKHNQELYENWKHYSDAPHDFIKNFTTKIFSCHWEIERLPYYFYPFLFEMEVAKAEGQDKIELEKKLRSFYFDIVIYVLKTVHQEFGIDEWISKK